MYLHCDCIICYTTSTILIWDTGAFLEESVILLIYLPTKFKSKYIVQFQDFNIITKNIMKLQTLRVFSHIHCCVKVRCINYLKDQRNYYMQLPSTHQTISYGDKENDELVRMVSYLECSSKKDNFQLAAAILTAKEPSTMDIAIYGIPY